MDTKMEDRNVLTKLERKTQEAIILAEGPSKQKLLDSPGFVAERTLAVINRAGLTWPYLIDYWITYHAEWIARWWVDRELNGYHPADLAIVSKSDISKIKHIPICQVTKQVRGLNSGGTSAIFAAMVLLDIGYDPVHLFGVDLTKEYSKERKFWSILQGQPLIFHGEDWFHRNYFHPEEDYQ